MMSVKLLLQAYLKRVYFEKKVRMSISVYDAINNILSRDLNYVGYMVMWRFGNSSFSAEKLS